MTEQNIYTQEFMHYYKNPNHKGRLENPQYSAKTANLSCGDSIELEINTENNIVKKCGYNGTGCIVSLGCAELLAEHVEGKSLEELRSFSKDNFFDLIGFELTFSRQKCALISFNALQKIIDAK